MLKVIKKQLIDDIKMANENNELTVQKMYKLTFDNVTKYANVTGEETDGLYAVIKDIVTLSVQALVDADVFCADKVFAILQGIADGVKLVESKELNNIQNELIQAKKQLIEEEKILANNFRIALDGAEEASENFTGSIRDDIEAALADTKLKNTELLGLTKGSVKEAIFSAIETSTQLENDIITIVCGATTKALDESIFNTERISKITESVLLAAVEAAEEMEVHVLLTASSATEGVRQGLGKSIETTHGNITKTGDLKQVKKGLESVGNVFTKTLHKVADNSGKPAKEILHDLAHDVQKSGSTLREKAVLATQIVAERIDDELDEKLPSKTEKSRITAEESKVLGKRMLIIARNTKK